MKQINHGRGDYRCSCRPILYDVPEDEIQELPKWLIPVKTDIDFKSLGEGDGRNDAFYRYTPIFTGHPGQIRDINGKGWEQIAAQFEVARQTVCRKWLEPALEEFSQNYEKDGEPKC